MSASPKIHNSEYQQDPKEKNKLTNEKTILQEGVIMDEIGIEEVDQVIAPGILLGD